MSGGERSYATLALLLALGASHESPFRVMDEFDVSINQVHCYSVSYYTVHLYHFN
jgi:structural maintenance of chromosomes protein 6